MDDDVRAPAPSPSHPIRNTALRWAILWLVPGVGVMRAQGSSHAMTTFDVRPVILVVTALAGGFFGMLFASLRRAWPGPVGWRRAPGEPHSLRSRAGAFGLSAALGVVIAGLLFREFGVALGFGVLMGVSAFIAPGNADLPSR